MIEYIYAFGSICRGELDSSSDIDVLVIHSNEFNKLKNRNYSYYKKETLKELWEEGNPFAWHLHKEARIIYSINNEDFIAKLKTPNTYRCLVKDLKYLNEIFREAFSSINANEDSIEFDLSTIFLVIRNVATCYELGVNQKFCFTRDSAIQVSDNKLRIDELAYNTLKKCRILSTRGFGENPTSHEIESVKNSLPLIQDWINQSITKSENYESIQTKAII